MKSLRYIIALLFFTLALSSYAQPDRSIRPQPAPAKPIELGDYKEFILPNGLTVIVVENHKLPQVTFSLRLKVDPVYQGAKKGYIEATGDLMKNGTTTRKKADIDSSIDFMGAYVSTWSTGAEGGCLTKHIDRFMPVFSDVILNPVFPQDELDKWKEQTKSGLKANSSSPGAIAAKLNAVITYGPNHPMGENLLEETVDSFTREDMVSYYSTYFKPNVAYLAIVGDIKFDDAKKLAKQYFGKWQKGKVPSHTYAMPQAPEGVKVAFVDKTGAVQSDLSIVYPLDLKPDNPDVLKATVMNEILGGSSFSARFMQNLRETYSYTYGAYSTLRSDKVAGSFRANASVRNSVTDSATTQFLYEMKRMTDEPVSDSVLRTIINFVGGRFARSLENPKTIADFALRTKMYNLPANYYKNYLANLEKITPADIQEMAKRYLKPANCWVLVVGNKDEVAHNLLPFASQSVIDYYDTYARKVEAPKQKALAASEVIQNYIKAVGGAESVSNIKNLTLNMKIAVMGQQLDMQLFKQPGKMAMKQSMQGRVLSRKVYANGKGFNQGMQGNNEMSATELDDMKVEAELLPELKYNELNVKVETKGVETFNGKLAYKVEVQMPSGKKVSDYFDVSSGLKLGNVSTEQGPQGEMTITSTLTDYREVAGIKMPFKISMDMGMMKMDMLVDNADVTTIIPESEFLQ